jgi:hypothetical protein
MPSPTASSGGLLVKRNLKADFETAWDAFLVSTLGIADALGGAAARGESVHDLLASLHAVTYWKAKGLVMSGAAAKSRLNPGPLTGLFFERFAGSVFQGYLGARHPNATFFVGCGSVSYSTRDGLPRDPDLCVQQGDRTVVVEFKVSPKKRDLDYLEQLHSQYSAEGMLFLFCGGEVIAQRPQLERIVAGGWACFLESRKSNESIVRVATVDRLLTKADAWLGSA